MSASALPIEGSFFFTDVDPEVALKDSRDPLGFQPIWSHFGRKLVGNLTTVTTSVRGFTTLLLGHHLASRLVESGGVPAAEYIEPFLRFEQIAAYSRVAWAEETGDAVGTLQALTGGLKVKVRVQHPKILEAKFREGWMWFFRYYADDVQADGSVKTVRKKHAVGLSRGDDKITKKQAEIERDKFLAKLNAPTVETAVEQMAATFEETARVLQRLTEPHRLIVETCIATGARISEVLGLHWRHGNLDAGTIKIEQRVWQQEVGPPKSENSRRTLGLGDLVARYREKAAEEGRGPNEFVFQQKWAPGRPMWDTTTRNLLHEAARAEGCDFAGLGFHSFRRANITWRQEVGGSAIEASRIAGHRDLEMTSEYTFVAPERQNELTRRIQQKLAEAAREPQEKRPVPEVPPPAAPSAPGAPPALADANPVTRVIQ